MPLCIGGVLDLLLYVWDFKTASDMRQQRFLMAPVNPVVPLAFHLMVTVHRTMA